MVVKTNRGIYEVTSVDIICEKRVPFNGQVVRLVQKANNIADASALKFNFSVSALELPYVYTDQIEHTARCFSAWLPPIQCTLSGHQCMMIIQG